MNHIELSREIELLRVRTDRLREDVMRDDAAPSIVHRALAEIRSSLEELHVADEELRAQNAELVRINAALERERRRYAALFDGAPIGYVVTDGKGILRAVNRAAAGLLRHPVGALLDKPFALLLDRPERVRWQALLDQVLTAAGSPRHEVFQRTTADGIIRMRVEGCAPEDEEGKVSCRWILEDDALRDLAAATRRMEMEARRKDEFLATLGHELRNPLTPIRAAVELWHNHADTLSETERRWTVDVVRRQSEHIVRLVDDILDIARMTHGKIRLRRSVVDLRDIVEDVCEVLRAQARRPELDVVLPPMSVCVDGDGARLRQVVTNLLDNAMKFTPPDGHVRVHVGIERGLARIAVRDDGIGIVPEMLERVFVPFAQADRSLSRAGAGLGLGLPLVRRLVELHGGTVSVHSDGADRGSEFAVSLPMVAAPAAGSEPHPAALPSRRLRLLVVDDNADAAEMMARVLERQGHETTLVFDGAGAVESFERLHPDAVLLDLALPDFDGFEVARRIRELSPRAHLVALTGYGDEQTRERVRAAGFTDHLLKPLDLDALRGVLRIVANES